MAFEVDARLNLNKQTNMTLEARLRYYMAAWQYFNSLQLVSFVVAMGM